MANTDEIRRRVEEADTARSAKRSAAAQQIGELAQRWAAIAEQLADIERQLGDVLTAAEEIMDVDELARFTDVPAADLARWLTARKTTRTKRKRPAAGSPGEQSDTSRGPAPARTPTADKATTVPEPAVHRTNTDDAAARITPEVA